ncbi:unnamed protein product [Sympodiomycopsis kandeliae]
MLMVGNDTLAATPCGLNIDNSRTMLLPIIQFLFLLPPIQAHLLQSSPRSAVPAEGESVLRGSLLVGKSI